MALYWNDLAGYSWFHSGSLFPEKILAVRSIESAPMIEITFVTSSCTSSASVKNKTENPSKDADVSTYLIKDVAECGSIVYI